MALRWWLSGINKLIDSNALGTIELSTGLQISGVFSSVMEHEGKPFTFKLPEKRLAYREKKLVGHGTLTHAEGF
jgi:phenylalanine-4-hydroxylase